MLYLSVLYIYTQLLMMRKLAGGREGQASGWVFDLRKRHRFGTPTLSPTVMW